MSKLDYPFQKRTPRFVSLLLLLTVASTVDNARSDTTHKPSGPVIRVLVAENQKSLSITTQGGYLVRSLPGLHEIKKGEKLKSVPVKVSAKGIQWGDEVFSTAGIRIEPVAPRDLFLNKSRFRGVVDIQKSADSLIVINRVGIEDYLYGVLHHEVAPWWPMEALKAQAVAARTYALYQAQANRAAPFDLKSSTSSQVYGGSTTERYRTRMSVDQTAGQVLTYQGKLFPAYFHATCAGRTAGAGELWKTQIPPLAGGVRCGTCRISPHYFWHARIPLSEIEELFNKNGRPLGRVLKIEIITQTPSGRVGSLRATGTAGEAVIAAKDFRIWVSGGRMRSTSFTVTVNDDAAEFHGKGWGHGVGLCQWGALGQSLLGRTYRGVLKFYYPGAEITDYKD